MRLRGILMLIKPTKGDEHFYARWTPLGDIILLNNLYSPDLIEAIVTDHHSAITESMIRQFKNLKYVVSPNTGHTHLQFKSCSIKTLSLKGETTFLNSVRSVSEFTFYYIMRFLKQDSHDIPHTLANKKIGIIGLGRIGRRVYKVAQAFDMNVAYFDIEPRFGFEGFENLHELMRSSDIVTIHIPENDRNNGFIGEQLIKSMKKTAYLINTSRASVIDEKALEKALMDKAIKGAALDVFDKINRRIDNLLLTDHIAGHTLEDRIATDRFMVKKLAKELNLPLDNTL